MAESSQYTPKSKVLSHGRLFGSLIPQSSWERMTCWHTITTAFTFHYTCSCCWSNSAGS